MRLQSVDPGFRAEQSLTFRVALPGATYDETTERAMFYQNALERIASLPGVRTVGAINMLPLSGGSFGFSFEVAGWPPPRPGEEPTMQTRVVTPGFFDAMDIPIRRGRGFTPDDDENSPQVVLLSDAAVRRFFPNEDPIGKRITLGWGRGPGRPRNGGEVVGVVGSVKQFGLDEVEQPEIYIPHAQQPIGGMSFVVHTAVPPLSVAEGVRAEIRSLDPSLPIVSVQSLESLVARSISQPRFYMMLLTIFASVALLLASIGIFGVVSYAVAQRTREMGIRIALGATTERVLWMVLGNAMRLALIGVAVGLAASFALSRTLATLLFDLSPTDPVTFVAVGAGLTAVALVASYLPAWRATRVDPVVALRAE
jgi:predicted permease